MSDRVVDFVCVEMALGGTHSTGVPGTRHEYWVHPCLRGGLEDLCGFNPVSDHQSAGSAPLGYLGMNAAQLGQSDHVS